MLTAPLCMDDLVAAPCHKQYPSPVTLAQQIVALDQLVVIETTATDLGPGAELIEFAALDAAGHTLLNTYIRPKAAIPGSVTRVHAITDADVANAPELAEVWPAIARLLVNRPVAGYQVAILQRILRRSAQQIGATLMNSHWIAIGDLYGQYTARTRWCSLEAACGELALDIPLGQRALSRARAVFAILKTIGRTG